MQEVSIGRSPCVRCNEESPTQMEQPLSGHEDSDNKEEDRKEAKMIVALHVFHSHNNPSYGHQNSKQEL